MCVCGGGVISVLCAFLLLISPRSRPTDRVQDIRARSAHLQDDHIDERAAAVVCWGEWCPRGQCEGKEGRRQGEGEELQLENNHSTEDSPRLRAHSQRAGRVRDRANEGANEHWNAEPKSLVEDSDHWPPGFAVGGLDFNF